MLIYQDNLFYGASAEIRCRARELRKGMTDAEKHLWKYLRGRKLGGYKFRRQHPVDIFIVDFYCHEKKLVVELDGRIHERRGNREYDKNRTAEMERYGIKVIRFTNEEVLKNTDQVIGKIREECNTRDV